VCSAKGSCQRKSHVSTDADEGRQVQAADFFVLNNVPVPHWGHTFVTWLGRWKVVAAVYANVAERTGPRALELAGMHARQACLAVYHQ
jgi:hypothetical protein